MHSVGRVLALLAVAIPASFGQAAGQAETKKPVAVVAGQVIYEDELRPLVEAKMRQFQNEEYQARSQALESLVNQKLLAAEAKNKGIPQDKLLEQEVDSKIGEPSEGEVEAYYLGQRDRMKRPLNQIKGQLRQALQHARIQQARQDYLASLREKAEVTILLRPPKVQVGYDPARLRGRPDAPVTIVEFSDFQCPYCRRAQSTLRDVLAKYSGKVNLAFRDFPLRQIHPSAQSAAEAARCAGEQGKFWEYHDALFADQSRLDPPGLSEHARSLGLDTAQFNSCLSGGKYKSAVGKDLQEGIAAGVSGTPGFFINGVFLNGAQPASEFEKVIDDELAALERKRPQ